MLRPNKIHLPPSQSFTAQSEPASPPDTPLANSLPESLSSPTLPPSPSSSTARPTSSMSMLTAIRENIQVMARVRPHSSQEWTAEQASSCWVLGPAPGMIATQESGRRDMTAFQFDAVISGTDNKAVYDTGIGDLVKSTMAGYNGTVFAYGQTASGKTYTMMGTDEEPGVIPRAIKDLFAYIEENPGREYLLRVSYMEIYKEKIRDLITEGGDDKVPEIHEDKKRGVYVTNLREVYVVSAEQVMDVIRQGEKNRHVGETDYNARSSRSHTIFQIVIESRGKNRYSNRSETVCISQLNLIDLAGSERATTDKERRAEGSYINKSLLALGNVISQLTARQNCDQNNIFVQYRTSTLTRVLQTALSGNARVSVICAINPTLKCRNESLSTLRFAQRAKQIRTVAKMTKINENSKLREYIKKIELLQSFMQEKTEQEVETRDRLNQLLSIILTSSKTSPLVSAMTFDFAERLTNGTEPLTRETMHEVFTQCEQGLNAHREVMARLEHELSNAERDKMDLSMRLLAAQSENKALATQLQEAKNTYHALAKDYEELVTGHQMLEEQLRQSRKLEQEHQQTIATVQAELTETFEAKEQHDAEVIEELQTFIEAAEAEKRSLGEHVKHMEDQIEQERRSVQHLESQIEQAQNEIARLQTAVAEAAIAKAASTSEEFVVVRREHSQEEEEEEEMKIIKQYAAELEAMRAEKEEIQKENDAHAAKIAALTAEVETSASELRTAKENHALQMKELEEYHKEHTEGMTEHKVQKRPKINIGLDGGTGLVIKSFVGAAVYALVTFACK